MAKVISAIEKAFGKSSVAGKISIRRFSATRFSIKRFSEDGEVISSTIVDDESMPATEDIVDTLPENEEVAVFSDETDNTEEIVVSTDGGSIADDIETAPEEGFEEDTKKFSRVGENEKGEALASKMQKSVDEYLGDSRFGDDAELTKKQLSKDTKNLSVIVKSTPSVGDLIFYKDYLVSRVESVDASNDKVMLSNGLTVSIKWAKREDGFKVLITK